MLLLLGGLLENLFKKSPSKVPSNPDIPWDDLDPGHGVPKRPKIPKQPKKTGDPNSTDNKKERQKERESDWYHDPWGKEDDTTRDEEAQERKRSGVGMTCEANETGYVSCYFDAHKFAAST